MIFSLVRMVLGCFALSLALLGMGCGKARQDAATPPDAMPSTLRKSLRSIMNSCRSDQWWQTQQSTETCSARWQSTHQPIIRLRARRTRLSALTWPWQTVQSTPAATWRLWVKRTCHGRSCTLTTPGVAGLSSSRPA